MYPVFPRERELDWDRDRPGVCLADATLLVAFMPSALHSLSVNVEGRPIAKTTPQTVMVDTVLRVPQAFVVHLPSSNSDFRRGGR